MWLANGEKDSHPGCGYGKQLSYQYTFEAPSGRPDENYSYRVYAAFGTLTKVETR
jgi:hypothetical protein